MEYKFMKVYRQGNQTLGVRTYSDAESDHSNQDKFPTEYVIERIDPETGEHIPAEIEPGFHPIAHFQDPSIASNFIAEGESPDGYPGPHSFLYIGPPS